MSAVNNIERLLTGEAYRKGNTPEKVLILEAQLRTFAQIINNQRAKIVAQRRNIRSLNRIYNAYLAGAKAGAAQSYSGDTAMVPRDLLKKEASV